MVDRQTRVKKRKFRRTPGAKTAVHYTRKKISKAKCGVTGKVLAGTGNQSKTSVRKKAKTKRRPSVKFGGVLGSKSRRDVWENYALIESGKKDINDIPTKLKRFVKISIKEAAK